MSSGSEARPPYKGLLWKVIEKDQTYFYLWGVAHSSMPNELVLSNKLNKIFSKTNQLVVELNFEDVKNINSYQLKEDQRLSRMLEETTKNKLNSAMQKIRGSDVDFGTIDKMHPLVIYFALNNFVGLLNRPTGMSSEYPGPDKQLWARANLTTAKIDYLESSLDVFSSWLKECPSIQDNSKLLENSLDILLLDNSAISNVLIKQYNDTSSLKALEYGNLPEFERLEEKTLLEYQSEAIFHKCSVIPRNHLWAKKLVTLKQDNTQALIVVGAAHLVGKGSLIELLKKDGYKVELIEQEE
jgi:uncharacterized protein